MSNHLSEDQFIRCAVGRAERAELQHLGECSDCSGEVDRFAGSLSLFQGTIRRRIENRISLKVPKTIPVTPVEQIHSKWRWALIAATVVIMTMLPFLTRENKPRVVVEPVVIETDPDAIMNAVNFHLSGTVSAPMEPMLSLIPSEQFITKSGGVQ